MDEEMNVDELLKEVATQSQRGRVEKIFSALFSFWVLTFERAFNIIYVCLKVR